MSAECAKCINGSTQYIMKYLHSMISIHLLKSYQQHPFTLSWVVKISTAFSSSAKIFRQSSFPPLAAMCTTDWPSCRYKKISSFSLLVNYGTLIHLIILKQNQFYSVLNLFLGGEGWGMNECYFAFIHLNNNFMWLLGWLLHKRRGRLSVTTLSLKNNLLKFQLKWRTGSTRLLNC